MHFKLYHVPESLFSETQVADSTLRVLPQWVQGEMCISTSFLKVMMLLVPGTTVLEKMGWKENETYEEHSPQVHLFIHDRFACLAANRWVSHLLSQFIP
jgi:hypothetical protein